MKDEPRNRSVWERVKMAFRLLFSVKALEPLFIRKAGKMVVEDSMTIIRS